jgi:uncharacterized membrane protein YfcA
MQLDLTSLTTFEWIWVLLCGLMMGMSKSGVNGLGTRVVPVFAVIFGARPSTGLLLPMLCMADIMAVAYYRRSARWKHIWRLLPWAVAGFGAALLVDHLVPSRYFRILIAISILIGLPLMIWKEKKGAEVDASAHPWMAPLFGLLGGMATMIGNAAGPIMSVYLLFMRLPKQNFVGTAAWFFLIVNLLKLPLQWLVWDNITMETLRFNFMLFPAIVLGILAGIWLVRYVSERNYRNLVLLLTLISTLMLFF